MEEVPNIITENKIRKGGKQPLGKPPLKHTTFYYCFGLNKPDNEELRQQVKTILNTLSEKIENELMILQGSQQGFKSFNLPIIDSRETLMRRIEGRPKVKFLFEIGKQTNNLYAHYSFSISKRGLDSQIDNRKVKEFFETQYANQIILKSQIYRDAKNDLPTYAKKADVL